MTPPISLTLASASPRRRELLRLCGWTFRVAPVEIDETPRPGEDPAAYAVRVASEKARAAEAVSGPDAVILASDTTVADGGEILGKPGSPAEAQAMLVRLRGRIHQVHTTVAVVRDGSLTTDLATTDVPMRHYSDREIEEYIETGDPFDKAGGYAIQHRGFHPVEGLAGCYANVMGLPLCHVARTMEGLGIGAAVNIPQACQRYLDYACPVYGAVLRREL